MKTIDETIAQYDYDASKKAYDESPMVKMLLNRGTDVSFFLDKYTEN